MPVTANVAEGNLYFITFNATSKVFRVKGIDTGGINNIKFYNDLNGSLIIVRSGVYINYMTLTYNNATFEFITPPSDVTQYTEVNVV